MKKVLLPAIDLLGGRAVRLLRGERATAKVYSEDPPAQARLFAAQGARALHVVDLDAAFGGARQLRLIQRIATAASGLALQVGGGLRNLDAAAQALEAGASRIILGTAAVEDPALAGRAVARFGVERVAVGIDVKAGQAAVRGWTTAPGLGAADFAQRLAGEGVSWLVVTAVARDGTLDGFDLDLLREVAAAAPTARIIASGGAGELVHLHSLAGLPSVDGAIVGTALYEGRFTLAEGQAAIEGPAAAATPVLVYRTDPEDDAAPELFSRKEPGGC